jgi:hypothetical protein
VADSPLRLSYADAQGLLMVQLIVVDFFDYALLGVVIVAIAVAILIIRINNQ